MIGFYIFVFSLQMLYIHSTIEADGGTTFSFFHKMAPGCTYRGVHASVTSLYMQSSYVVTDCDSCTAAADLTFVRLTIDLFHKWRPSWDIFSNNSLCGHQIKDRIFVLKRKKRNFCCQHQCLVSRWPVQFYKFMKIKPDIAYEPRFHAG